MAPKLPLPRGWKLSSPSGTPLPTYGHFPIFWQTRTPDGQSCAAAGSAEHGRSPKVSRGRLERRTLASTLRWEVPLEVLKGPHYWPPPIPAHP